MKLLVSIDLVVEVDDPLALGNAAVATHRAHQRNRDDERSVATERDLLAMPELAIQLVMSPPGELVANVDGVTFFSAQFDARQLE
jgi:hypothetical protein